MISIAIVPASARSSLCICNMNYGCACALYCHIKKVDWLLKRAPHYCPNMIDSVLHAPSHNSAEPPPTAVQNGSLDCGPKPRSQGAVAATIRGQNAARVWGYIWKSEIGNWKKVESKFGHFVARPLARKWPERPGSESFLCRESLNIWLWLAKNLGRFLDIGLATLWPHFFPMFHWRASGSGLRFGPHFGQKSWLVSWLRGSIWEALSGVFWRSSEELSGEQSGEHHGVYLGGVWDIVWGVVWAGLGGGSKHGLGSIQLPRNSQSVTTITIIVAQETLSMRT